MILKIPDSHIINYNPKAINHLKNALQKFKKYDLSPIFIISLIEKYLYPNPNLQFTAKKPKDCTKFMIEVYLWQYSAGTNMNGYDPTTADRQATVAASWVYVGCVYGAY